MDDRSRCEQTGKSNEMIHIPVRLSLSASHSAVFFSYNKSASAAAAEPTAGEHDHVWTHMNDALCAVT
jgi:hypothetical protein